LITASCLWLADSAQAETVTVGSPLTQAFAPSAIGEIATIANTTLPEQGVSVVSPLAGQVMRWRVKGASGGPFYLDVLRPVGEGYEVTAFSEGEKPASTGVETFPAGIGMPVLPGDLIAIRNSSSSDEIGTATPLMGAQFSAWKPPLERGEPLPPTQVGSGREIAFNADVQPPPTITSITPGSGSFTGGTKVTIAGSDFTHVIGVKLGNGDFATDFEVDSESQVSVVTPKSVPGTTNITVITTAGSSVADTADQFTYTACVVPKLKGKKLKAAKKNLAKSGCKIGKVTKRKGASAKKGKVLRQGSKPGKDLAPGSKVGVALG
jgi:hypothetical protein